MGHYAPNYYLACRIQDKILNMMGIIPQSKKRYDPDAKRDLAPGELASLTKAFDLMEDRKRVLRNKGLPKAVEVKQKPAKGLSATFSE